jgi:hypothetical protein
MAVLERSLKGPYGDDEAFRGLQAALLSRGLATAVDTPPAGEGAWDDDCELSRLTRPGQRGDSGSSSSGSSGRAAAAAAAAGGAAKAAEVQGAAPARSDARGGAAPGAAAEAAVPASLCSSSLRTARSWVYVQDKHGYRPSEAEIINRVKLLLRLPVRRRAPAGGVLSRRVAAAGQGGSGAGRAGDAVSLTCCARASLHRHRPTRSHRPPRLLQLLATQQTRQP